MKVSSPTPPPPVSSPVAPPAPAVAAQPPGGADGRVIVVGAGPAGMATAIELAQRGVPSVVLEKRGAVATRENLFNVTPPLGDRLAALDPDGSLTRLLVPTERMVSEDATTGKVGERRFDGALAADPARSRGDMDALVRAVGSPAAEGADTRRWAKVGIGDLENALRGLATSRYGDLVELRSNAGVVDVRQGDGWVEAVLDPAGGAGAGDAVRGAFLVDATGADLLGGPRRVLPEQAHWLGGRFAPPADGATATRRLRAVTEDATDPLVTIKLPTADRTMVWAQVPSDARAISDGDRATLLERRAAAAGVQGGLAEPRRTAPVSVQLWTSEEPARGRVLKVGDSVRAPYFPTSTGAAAALVHDAPRAVDAILAARSGTPVEQAVAGYADAVRGANERLLGASRTALLADLGLTPDQAGPSTVVERAPVAGASPQSA